MKNYLTAMLLGVLVVTGCNDHETETANSESEMEALAYTLYTDKTELFVEFKPLVVGTESRFAAHFTALGEYFKAIDKGIITLTLKGKNGQQSITATKPEIPGIFRLRMTPEKAGDYTLIFDIKTPVYTDQVIIDNVKVYPDEKTALADQPAESSGGGEITYLKEQAWKIDFANMPVKKQTFYEMIKTSGQIMPAPGDEVIISAKSSGIVFFNGTNSVVGSPVSKGENLFTISGSGLTEENIDTKFKEAKVNYERAKADYERAKELINDKIISQKDFLEIQNRYETNQTIFNSLAQNYTGTGTRITSPLAGYVKTLYVAEGQFVQLGDPIASVSQNKKIVLKADVSQKYFSKLSAIQSANFITVDHTVYNTTDLNGRVLAFGKSTSDNNAFVPVTFEMDNQGTFLPGSYVDVYLRTSPIQDALVIPVSALQEEQGLYYIYIQLEGESFTKREVKLGGTDGNNVQVLSGINEGERVVTKGAYNIKLSVASGTLPAHGHEH